MRNALLGRPVHEIDFATTATPDDDRSAAPARRVQAVPTGIEHGTVTVVVDGAPFEVTTLARGRRDGRPARRGPLRPRFRRRRAAARLHHERALARPRWALHDYARRARRSAARRVRFIGDPAARIREDFLRILRFFRFYAAYDEGDARPRWASGRDPRTRGAGVLSPERIRAELLKLLAARRAVAAVAAMSEAGLLTRLSAASARSGVWRAPPRTREAGSRMR